MRLWVIDLAPYEAVTRAVLSDDILVDRDRTAGLRKLDIVRVDKPPVSRSHRSHAAPSERRWPSSSQNLCFIERWCGAGGIEPTHCHQNWILNPAHISAQLIEPAKRRRRQTVRFLTHGSLQAAVRLERLFSRGGSPHPTDVRHRDEAVRTLH